MTLVKSRIERQFQIEWKGLIGIYLFLGGLGAGAYTVGAVASILGKSWAYIAEVGVYLSLPLVVIGTLFLMAHLGKPFRAPLALAKAGSSWISRGVWFLGIFMLISVIHIAMLYTGKDVHPAIPILGMLAATMVMVYTGALLSGAKGYPFWRTGVLPMLFLISALFTGLMVVLLGVVIYSPSLIVVPHIIKLSAIGAGLAIVELLAIMVFLNTAYRTRNSKESAKRMASKGSFIFGDLILGLLIPMIIMMVIYFTMKDQAATGLVTPIFIAAILGLIGGFLLRYTILSVGMAKSLDTAGFMFRPIAQKDFERSPVGKLPPQ